MPLTPHEVKDNEKFDSRDAVPLADEAGNYRLITELGLEAPILRDVLGFKVALTDKTDSRP